MLNKYKLIRKQCDIIIVYNYNKFYLLFLSKFITYMKENYMKCKYENTKANKVS